MYICTHTIYIYAREFLACNLRSRHLRFPCVYVYFSIYLPFYIYIYIFIICIYIHMYVCMYVYIDIDIYMYMRTCRHTYVCTFIHK